jgi:hypothetical protein
MEHNLVEYVKNCSCGSTKILGVRNSQEVLIIVEEIFLDIGK